MYVGGWSVPRPPAVGRVRQHPRVGARLRRAREQDHVAIDPHVVAEEDVLRARDLHAHVDDAALAHGAEPAPPVRRAQLAAHAAGPVDDGVLGQAQRRARSGRPRGSRARPPERRHPGERFADPAHGHVVVPPVDDGAR